MNEENQNQNPQGQVFQPPEVVSSAHAPLVALNNPKSNRPKNFKKVYGLIIAVFIVILAAVGTILFLSQNDNKNTDEIMDNSKLSQLNELISSGGSLISKATGPSLVVSKVKDNIWVGLPEGSEVLNYSSIQNTTDQNKSDYDRLKNVLIDFGLSDIKTTSSISSKYSSDDITQEYLSSEDVVCNLSNKYESAPAKSIYYLNLYCSNRHDFESEISKLSVFVDAYLEAEDSKDDVLFGISVVQNSPVQAYKNAKITSLKLGQEEVMIASFYQTPDEKWHFFNLSGASDEVMCSRYNTSDTISAFVGFSCKDDSTGQNSYVQLKNPVFEDVTNGTSGG